MNKKHFLSLMALSLIGMTAISIGHIENIKSSAEATKVDFVIDSVELKYENSAWYMWFASTGADWPSDYATYYNISAETTYGNALNYRDNIYFDDTAIGTTYWNGSPKVNMWVRPSRFSFSVKNPPENLKTLTIKKGCEFPSFVTLNGGAEKKLVISEDIIFTANKVNDTTYSFKKNVVTNDIDTNVTSIKTMTGYNKVNKFFIFGLSVSDYDDVTENAGNDFKLNGLYAVKPYGDVSNFSTNMLLNGSKLNLEGHDMYLNYYTNYHALGVEMTSTIANLANNDVITIPKGTSFPSYSYLKGNSVNAYVTTKDIDFTYKDGAFTKVVDVEPVDSKINGVKVVDAYQEGLKFLVLKIYGNDYKDVSENKGNDFDINGSYVQNSYIEGTNFFDNVLFNNQKMDIKNRNAFLNYYGNYGGLAFYFTNEAASLKDGDTITINKDATFPSYAYLKNTGKTIYKMTDEVTYIYSDGAFRKSMEKTCSPTSITGLSLTEGYNTADTFLIVTLSENDYSNIEENNGLDFDLEGTACVNAYSDCTNFAYTMKLNGEVMNVEGNRMFFNYRNTSPDTVGTIGINFNSFISNLKDYDVITINSNTTFPSYGILKGTSEIVYETQEEVEFTYFSKTFHVCAPADGAGFEHDENGHWQECSVCHKKINEDDHHLIEDDKAPTCIEPGYTDCTFCDVCGYVSIEGTPINPLGHSYENAEYQYDETGHWQCCVHDNCQECSEKVDHVWGEDRVTCLTCGYIRNAIFVDVTNGYINGQDYPEVVPGSEITIIADTPADGYMFDGWYINDQLVSSDSTYTFVVNENTQIEARFTVDPNYKKDDDNGKTKRSGCQGDIITLTSGAFISALSLVSLVVIKKKKY